MKNVIIDSEKINEAQKQIMNNYTRVEENILLYIGYEDEEVHWKVNNYEDVKEWNEIATEGKGWVIVNHQFDQNEYNEIVAHEIAESNIEIDEEEYDEIYMVKIIDEMNEEIEWFKEIAVNGFHIGRSGIKNLLSMNLYKGDKE